MEDARDVVGVADNIDDTHASATPATDGDVDGEDAGEQVSPAEVAGARGRLGRCGGVVLAGVGELERELLRGRRDGRGRNDALHGLVTDGVSEDLGEEQVLPSIGYDRYRELEDSPARERLGLPEERPSTSGRCCRPATP